MEAREYRVKVLSGPQVVMIEDNAEVVVVVIPLSVEEYYADQELPVGAIGPFKLLPLVASLRCAAKKGDTGTVYAGGPGSSFSHIPRALVEIE